MVGRINLSSFINQASQGTCIEYTQGRGYKYTHP